MTASAPSITPLIVVAAYDRPASLTRLLGSLRKASYPDQGADLLISIDGGGSDQVEALAQAFEWPHGTCTTRRFDQNLGLREHILACGDLSQEAGAIILLEEDLTVSSSFYHYACAALAHSASVPQLAGIALYAPAFNETSRLPFTPLPTGHDAYHMQLPCSWGQAWTAGQWQGFRDWLAATSNPDLTGPDVPVNMRKWPDSSWKRLFYRYMVDHGLYFLNPFVSHSTNFGDRGKHFATAANHVQVPLAGPVDGDGHEWRFPPFATDTPGIYDGWCEPLAKSLKAGNPALQGFDFAVDLNGTRPAEEVSEAHILTCLPCDTAEQRFALALRPREANVLEGLPPQDGLSGPCLSLARTQDVPRSRRFWHRLRCAYDTDFDYLDLKRMAVLAPTALQAAWPILMQRLRRRFGR